MIILSLLIFMYYVKSNSLKTLLLTPILLALWLFHLHVEICKKVEIYKKRLKFVVKAKLPSVFVAYETVFL